MTKDTIYFQVEDDSVSEEANLYVVGVEESLFKDPHGSITEYKIYFGYNITDEINYHDYYTIGEKGTGIVLDGIEYMCDDSGMLDIKQINTHLYNRKISKVLEVL